MYFVFSYFISSCRYFIPVVVVGLGPNPFLEIKQAGPSSHVRTQKKLNLDITSISQPRPDSNSNQDHRDDHRYHHRRFDSEMANVDELLSSLISDIHTYTGKDPLLPWLRYPSIPSLSLFLCFPLNFSVYSLIIPNFTCSAIRKVKDTLPPKTLKEKLPAFLQKCAHTFELDRRYRNDMRYLRIWLHLVNQALFPSLLVI